MELWSGLDVPVWSLLLTLLLVLIYLYGVWPYSFFSSRGIPGPKPLPFIGNFADVFTKPEGENEANWTKQYGKIYGIYMGRQPLLHVHDPDIIHDIMVKDFAKFCNRESDTPINPPMDQSLVFIKDNHWRQSRNIVLPTFSTGKLKQMTTVITECGNRLLERFNEAATNAGEANTKELFGSFTLEVITATLFGLKVDALDDKNNPFLRNVREIFSVVHPVPYLIYKCFPFLRGINDLFGFGIWSKGSIQFFDNTMRKLIAERLTSKTDGRTDFLQLLINAYTDDLKTTGSSKKLSLDELSAQAFLFFVAGYETTATLMTFTAYNISRHPEVQEKVYNEIVEVCGDGEVTHDNLSQLKYLGQCLNETLRMFPPVMSMTRVAKEDVTLGGYDVPQGTAIQLPFYDIMRNPEVYPNPDTFTPDRFEDKRAASKPTFLPFGIGPRMCLGNRLALLESKVALSLILRKFILLPPKQGVDLKLLPGQLLNTVNKMSVGLKLRET